MDLSEKKGTGILPILRKLQKNDFPEPEFEMDDNRTYLNKRSKGGKVVYKKNH